MRFTWLGLSHLEIRFYLAILVAIAPAQASAQNFFNRCTSDPERFAQDVNLNTATAQYLSDLQQDIRFTENLSRMLGMAGLGDKYNETRSREYQYKQDLHRACSQISQSLEEGAQRQQRAETERALVAQRQQYAESERRKRLAAVEYELNRRVPGAATLMSDSKFERWLDGSQGKTSRRDAWDQAIATEKFDRAAQMLRDYKLTPTPR